jgi:hypothetical protein
MAQNLSHLVSFRIAVGSSSRKCRLCRFPRQLSDFLEVWKLRIGQEGRELIAQPKTNTAPQDKPTSYEKTHTARRLRISQSKVSRARTRRDSRSLSRRRDEIDGIVFALYHECSCNPWMAFRSEHHFIGTVDQDGWKTEGIR